MAGPSQLSSLVIILDADFVGRRREHVKPALRAGNEPRDHRAFVPRAKRLGLPARRQRLGRNCREPYWRGPRRLWPQRRWAEPKPYKGPCTAGWISEKYLRVSAG